MKLHYYHTKLPLYIISLLMITTIVSCGTVQTVADSDDGIYADDQEIEQERRVVVVDREEYKDYNENYFTKEIERLDALNGTDIFTDIENYKSDDSEFNNEEDIAYEEEPRTNITYSSNTPWGYNNNNSDVVININTSPRWGYYNAWGWDPFFDYGYHGYYGPWWRTRYWGYNPYWHPYNSGFYVGVGGFYNSFYCPPFYRNRFYGPYYNNRYYRPYRGANPYRGYRTASASRRGYTTGRRGTSVSRRSSNAYTRNNRNSSTRRSTRSTRSVRSTRGNSRGYNSSNRRSTRSYNSNGRSTRSTRGYNTRGTSRSSNRYTRGNRTSSNTRTTRGSSTRSNNRSYNNTGGYKPSRATTKRSTRSSRSNRSYSAPSRSTRSYSTPSRSSSSSRSYSGSRSSSRSSRRR
ncbi:hypothetical protein [Tenacibaculum aiptasiae]|uniref:hypothetical protein n=1 Tax=Tenacibaculum aiptasiae TaxID=426481 RepID=UPI00232D9D71|nr:hypothetical protein [Tenacibaculum aiptasiae]